MSADDLVSARVGFGCGRLHGGIDKKSSSRLVHAALDLGIRHFDVAPSYGHGTAEHVLGAALAGCKLPFTIATKVGIPRPRAPFALQALRAVVKPVARAMPGLRSLGLSALSSQRPSFDFHVDFIERSFRKSLVLLGRPSVDFLLLHEPSVDLDVRPIEDLLSSYVDQGRIGNYGSSTGSSGAALVTFGTVAQYRCPSPEENTHAYAEIEILHGAFRFLAPSIVKAVGDSKALRETLTNAGVLIEGQSDAFGAIAIAYVLANSRGKVLISTQSTQRLVGTLGLVREIVQCQDWQVAMNVLRNALSPALVVRQHG